MGIGNESGNGYDRMIEKRLDDLAGDVKALEDDVKGLLAWRNWVVGIVAGIGMLIGAFAKNVADIARHL